MEGPLVDKLSDAMTSISRGAGHPSACEGCLRFSVRSANVEKGWENSTELSSCQT